MAIQLADSASGMGYSFVLTTLILILMSLIGRVIPALRLRVNRSEEEMGIDDVEIGEFAYDYVELVRELKTPGVHDDDEYEHGSVVDRAHSQTAMGSNEKQVHSYLMQSLRHSPEDRGQYSGPYKGPYVGEGGIGLTS
jgi:Amt family ammonium transporter